MRHIEMFLRMVPRMPISAPHAGLLAERNISRALDRDLVHGNKINPSASFSQHRSILSDLGRFWRLPRFDLDWSNVEDFRDNRRVASLVRREKSDCRAGKDATNAPIFASRLADLSTGGTYTIRGWVYDMVQISTGTSSPALTLTDNSNHQ